MEKVDLSQVSCCLITKDPIYPKEILDHISGFPFGEILILTHSDSPFRKHELFAKAKFDHIYYQDDDAICPITDLVEKSRPESLNLAIKEGHYKAYMSSKMAMGLGWGAIFPKSILSSLKKYTDVYGEDEVFKRETERILTYLNFPHYRWIAPIKDLPSASAPDRLWRQPEHAAYHKLALERCQNLE